MTDAILLIGILAAWIAALVLMPRMKKKSGKPKLRPLSQWREILREHEAGTYDPSEDPEKIMRGQVESYFD